MGGVIILTRGMGERLTYGIMGITKFTQLHVVTSQFVMFIPCALCAWIEDGTGSRHVQYKSLVR